MSKQQRQGSYSEMPNNCRDCARFPRRWASVFGGNFGTCDAGRELAELDCCPGPIRDEHGDEITQCDKFSKNDGGSNGEHQ